VLGIADGIAMDHLRLVKVKEDFIATACPFHKGGAERKASFWINRHNGSWGCFSCSKSGSSLKYLLKALGISNRRVEAQLEEAHQEAKKTAEVDKARRKKKARASFRGECTLPEALLGVYDWLPEIMLDYGFPEELLAQHDIGYDRERQRVTFPIRDLYGDLIGISGRTTIGASPKYKVYQGRHMVDGNEVVGELGEWYPEYSSSNIRDHIWRAHFWYNDLFNRPHGKEGQLIIVEGYKAALHMVQSGWTETGAIMGSKMSAKQERIVRRLGAEVFILLDNNDAGHQGADQICQRLGVSTFPVYRCWYPEHCDDDAQPDDLNEDELEEVLATSERVGGKVYEWKKLSSTSFTSKEGKRGKRW